MRKRPLLLIACVFLAGLFYQRYEGKLLIGLVLFLLIQEVRTGRKRKKFIQMAGRSMILLSAFILGIFHMQQEENFRQAYMSKIVDGSRITVWGELINTETTEYGNRGVLSDCYIKIGVEIIPCNDIVVYTSKDHFQIGQIYKIIGKVNMFSEAQNEGNFDTCKYYQSLKIDFAVDEEESVLQGINTNFCESILMSLKERIGKVYQICLSQKAAGFYQAMVLGNKTNLDKELKNLFLLGGISHILAISGLHVSILGRGFYNILRKGGVGFGVAGFFGGILLVSYSVMVGNSVSTMRAVGMMLLFFLAQWLGKSYDMLNALGGMILFLLWKNPFLIENIGFWFSVTALLGVGFVGRELSVEKASLNGLWMSVGITLTTLPVTALSYYELPIYAPLVNFIVLPILTPIFCLAVCGGIIGIGFPGVAFLLLRPCQWLLVFYEWVCRIVSELPSSSVICGKPELWQLIFYYLILFTGIYLLQLLRKNSKRNIILGLMVFFCSVILFFPKAKEYEITFLDVGQGDGIYISDGDGNNFFIDGGSSNVKEVGEYRILPFLKAKGVSSIDYWFVSHTDSDHVSGLLEILESGYNIKNIVISEHCSKDDVYKDLVHIAKKTDTKILGMKAGQQIQSRELKIICLGPIVKNGELLGGDKNENSLVLQFEWSFVSEDKKYRALFAGDISLETEKQLCKFGLLEDIDLFKANHHGSNYSNGEELLGVILPEYIVVSCGRNNMYKHPGVQAVERMKACGAELFYTMESGQITFKEDDGKIKRIH